jgi:hypothetical protein
MSQVIDIEMKANGKYAYPGEPRRKSREVKKGEVHSFEYDQAVRIMASKKGVAYQTPVAKEQEQTIVINPATKDKKKAQSK